MKKIILVFVCYMVVLSGCKKIETEPEKVSANLSSSSNPNRSLTARGGGGIDVSVSTDGYLVFGSEVDFTDYGDFVESNYAL